MSQLSQWLHRVGDFLTAAVTNAPADQKDKITGASAQLKTAAAAVDQALPALAKVAVDQMLVGIGYGAYIPALNEILDAIAAEVISRKTNQSSVTVAQSGVTLTSPVVR